MRIRILFSIFLCFFSAGAFAQGASNIEASALAEIELYVKIGVAVISGIAALLGLPMVYLTYRKTSVEIKKLELESQQLLVSSQQIPSENPVTQEGLRVQISDSPNANVNVSADPRFLAPLLLLLDFVFAWVILSLAAHFLRFFNFGYLERLAELLLALFLLVPLAHQAIRIRSAMLPQEPSNKGPMVRQLKTILTVSYWLAIASCLGFGLLILYLDFTDASNVSTLGRYFAFVLVGLAAILLLATAWAKKRLEQYIESF